MIRGFRHRTACTPARSSKGNSKPPAPLFALLLATLLPMPGCSGPSSDVGQGASAPTEDTVRLPATATTTGTVEAIDTIAGKVTIAHGPVPALGWPAMTMPFQASPAQLARLRPGQKVRFEFDGDNATIISIAPEP